MRVESCHVIRTEASIKLVAFLVSVRQEAAPTLLVYSVTYLNFHRVEDDIEQHSLQCCRQNAAACVLQARPPEALTLAD